MPKKIPLTRGMFALVDDEDFDRISQFKWYAKPHRNTFYACRTKQVRNKKTLTTLHSEILKGGCVPRKLIDHINRNGLDNRKENLRLCTNSENQANSGLRKSNRSGFKGVCLKKPQNSWEAQIIHNGKTIHLGIFKESADAARAYDKKAIELKGEFALTNKNLGLLSNK